MATKKSFCYCGQCGSGFDSAQAELDHVCPKTGVKPSEPESMGANWEAIQQAAIQRGEEES